MSLRQAPQLYRKGRVMEGDTIIGVVSTLVTQLGTLLLAISWLSKRIDKLEAQFDSKLNNGISSKISNINDRLIKIESRMPYMNGD
jgi:hypothetical protein